MIRGPPRSTRTDPLRPYTTLFRSRRAGDLLVLRKLVDGGDRRGGSRAEARERQRQHTKNGPDRGVCAQATNRAAFGPAPFRAAARDLPVDPAAGWPAARTDWRPPRSGRSEEHTSELQSLMRISYAVFCLKKKKKKITT